MTVVADANNKIKENYDDIYNITGKNQFDTETPAGGPSTGSGQAKPLTQKAIT